MFCSHFGSKCKASSLRAIYTALNNKLAKTMTRAIAMHLLDNTRPINERLQAILEELEKVNLLIETPLSVEQMLVHPKNRGNLGLNPWNVHKIGADVQQTGAKKDVLRSVAIEMSQKAEVKQKQIDFNLKLCQRAGGAQVNCTEKFLSIGGSHFAAFCRAALACCPTAQQVLKDEDGNIDIAKLKKNPVMKELLEKGWTWQVITWKAEERYPGLAAFLQRALNAGNSVPNDMSEFEVMLCIIEHAAQEEDDIDWKKCQDIATHGNPRCS